MTQRSRRLARLVLAVALVTLAASACATDSTPSSSSTPDASPAFTVTPGASQPGPTDAPTQTDTDWGRIWDGVPTGFPAYPGAGSTTPSSPDPVSATWAVEGGDPLEIATWMQTNLEIATYSTEAMSGPLEDGGFVIDSVGEGDCRIESRISPQGGLIFISVRYGAACPID